ncbi:hypothetical protein ACHAQA_004281 [Verticillium albo-atrum]
MDHHHNEAPPPYPGHPSEQHEHEDAQSAHAAAPAPAYESLSLTPPTDDKKTRNAVQSTADPLRQQSSSNVGASSSSSVDPSPAKSSSRSPLSFIKDASQAYSDRKREKEASKKVDFYEKHYGFVPKNVLTEAEWKRIRKDAVKVKAPTKVQAKGYFNW